MSFLLRWNPEVVERRREFPEPCRHCRYAFRTARGARQHERFCSGAYDMLVRRVDSGHVRIVGSIFNGSDDFDRHRIGQSFASVADALQLPQVERMSYQQYLAAKSVTA
jgi:hypothetical protein